MTRVYNFSAGPANLPLSVLEEAQKDLVDYKGCGMSVMEMSHRSKDFQEIIDTAEADLRELLHMPENYRVIFMQGGATAQFAAIPMNLMKKGKADYIQSGNWSKKALGEAKMYGEVNVVASSEDCNYTKVPDVKAMKFSDDADYVYLCENETVYGARFFELPDTGDVPLVSDVSSMFLSEPHDVSKYGLLYGGVQKNIGPAGLAIVIVREDLVTEEVLPGTPSILNYKKNADAGSLMNTPNCWDIYMCGLTFKWLKELGGLEKIKEINERKAKLLYDYLDQSKLFTAAVEPGSRSLMNVPFVTGDADLDAKFVAESAAAGLKSLKGHRSVGGMRASIYNAMPEEGVVALVNFMEKFEKENA
ncbi:MAG: 3-phosphoserine/phosphohydroxythreonine transaminase [Phoenicibacter congonensis]|uniref:Phosphoserine aminotransferase n=1 Tax=Phoenicibacter congonensis TaxID=1944646 RepID=A0AA43UAU4_9ACTN|nr:3-phosphoserine/phosphohydroxythreonine transaminase [Phoenicibacter congonensis]